MVNPDVVPKVKLNNGVEIPILGYGTFDSKPGEVKQAVKDAIDAGYRHIDCAWAYRNEKEIGEAIKEKIDENVVKREDLFIVSKLWCTFHKPEAVEPALRESLNDLGVDYLDLYLMHQALDFKPGDNIFPIDENGQVIPGDADYVDTWKAMAECYKKGLVKSIGVSNFNRRQIERLLVMTKVVPVTNQVECHPYLSQKKLFEFCKSKGITITAHSTLGAPGSNYAKPNTPKVLEDAKIKAIAQKHNKTPAQVVLRWHIQRGIIAIPKSLNKNRINENIDIFDFQLTSDDIKQIDSMDCNGRMFALEWAKKHPYYPYNDEY